MKTQRRTAFGRALAASVLGASLAGPIAFADEGMEDERAEQQQQQQQQQQQASATPPDETRQEAQQRTQQLRQASGEVLELKSVDIRGTDGSNAVALLETERGDRRLVVDLGPEDRVEGKIDQGDRIRVEGVVHRIGDTQLLVARRVEAGGERMAINRQQQQEQHARMQRRSQQQRAEAQPPQDQERDDGEGMEGPEGEEEPG
jgi:hypothetical protein